MNFANATNMSAAAMDIDNDTPEPKPEPEKETSPAKRRRMDHAGSFKTDEEISDEEVPLFPATRKVLGCGDLLNLIFGFLDGKGKVLLSVTNHDFNRAVNDPASWPCISLYKNQRGEKAEAMDKWYAPIGPILDKLGDRLKRIVTLILPETDRCSDMHLEHVHRLQPLQVQLNWGRNVIPVRFTFAAYSASLVMPRQCILPAGVKPHLILEVRPTDDLSGLEHPYLVVLELVNVTFDQLKALNPAKLPMLRDLCASFGNSQIQSSLWSAPIMPQLQSLELQSVELQPSSAMPPVSFSKALSTPDNLERLVLTVGEDFDEKAADSLGDLLVTAVKLTDLTISGSRAEHLHRALPRLQNHQLTNLTLDFLRMEFNDINACVELLCLLLTNLPDLENLLLDCYENESDQGQGNFPYSLKWSKDNGRTELTYKGDPLTLQLMDMSKLPFCHGLSWIDDYSDGELVPYNIGELENSPVQLALFDDLTMDGLCLLCEDVPRFVRALAPAIKASRICLLLYLSEDAGESTLLEDRPLTDVVFDAVEQLGQLSTLLPNCALGITVKLQHVYDASDRSRFVALQNNFNSENVEFAVDFEQ
jgi:hypothetical protein